MGSLLLLGLALAGCGRAPEPTSTGLQMHVVPPAPKPRVSNRPADPLGRVFVAMYHHLGTRRDPMFRTPDQFRSDLERLDAMGFRPVRVSDYLSGHMSLAPGASPVVMTFDDSNPDQFRLLPDGSIDPNCMLGIWNAFALKHREFPIRATFFVLPDVMFGQRDMLHKKLALLRGWGCELADHTVTHTSLSKLDDAGVEREIGQAAADLAKLGVPMPVPLALPYGVSPRNKALLRGFEWQGARVAPTGVFLVGSNPAPSTDDPKFDRYAIPRIQANEGEYGLTYWLDKVRDGRVKVYVAP